MLPICSRHISSRNFSMKILISASSYVTETATGLSQSRWGGVEKVIFLVLLFCTQTKA